MLLECFDAAGNPVPVGRINAGLPAGLLQYECQKHKNEPKCRLRLLRFF